MIPVARTARLGRVVCVPGAALIFDIRGMQGVEISEARLDVPSDHTIMIITLTEIGRPVMFVEGEETGEDTKTKITIGVVELFP